jgi:hypothetical protein
VCWIVQLSSFGLDGSPSPEGDRLVSIGQSAIQPVGFSAGARGKRAAAISDDIGLGASDILPVFAPSPDPHNASRINIPYELNGHRGTFVATVTDSDYIAFAAAEGPATVIRLPDHYVRIQEHSSIFTLESFIFTSPSSPPAP